MTHGTITDTDRIRSALSYIDAADRDVWLRMGMAIRAGLGESGRELWDEWSQSADNYNPRDAADVWRSIRPDGKVSIGSLFFEAKQQGWKDDGRRHTLTPAEIAERQRAAAERAAADAAEIERERAETAAKAAAILKAATAVTGDNPYLTRKKVSPTATLREIDAAAAAAILGYTPKSGGEPLEGRLLVVPVKQGDALSTIELIDGKGRKTALAGRGSKAGGHWATRRPPDDADVLLIGEGVATVLSASEATGHAGVAALSSGNLMAVAKAMRDRYQGAELVLLADLLKTTGLPDPHAVEAARAVGARLAIPGFGPQRDPGDKDMNDLFVRCGAEAAQKSIASASAPSAQQAEPDADAWGEPLPLTAKMEPEPYPVDALPTAIREAVEEVQGFVKAPLPLVAGSALAALSLACQTHVDVKRAEKLQGPVSQFILVIADSGERKSTCDGFFSKPIRDFEAAQAEAAKPALKDHAAALSAWTAKCAGVTEKIRQLAKDKKPTAEMEAALRDLQHEKPEPPRVPRMIYTDITPEALGYQLAKGWPSAGIVSSEAGIVLGSHGMGRDSGMRNMATLNLLWDGATISSERRTTESWSARGARLTVALQVQEPTLRDFFRQQGTLARGTGFLARFLIAWPASTQGARPFTEAPANWPSLAVFHRRIAAILDQPAPIDEEGALQPIAIPLSPEAKSAWVQFHDAIESELSSGGELYDVRDVASKIADNAARLAALFQMFEYGIGAVSYDAFEGAARIAAWHLTEARRFFGELALPVELADAARLDTWLVEHCCRERTTMVGKNHVRQHGPLRDGARLDSAIRELSDLGRIRLMKDGKRLTIHVNPALVEVAG
ncbi:MAG: DUF3987 domain-containing protein [Thauera sp.]|nr:DUF3987 domain-containing protein [Thauera sp.]